MDKLKIIADTNIPKVDQSFNHIGEITKIPGREITKEKIKDADILLVRSVTKVNKELLEGTNIKFVATATIGEDHIDKGYLKSKNIGFSSAPGSNADSVAEYIITALYELSKKYSFNIQEKTLGIIGVGNVGSRVQKRAEILGLKTLLNDPPKKIETGDEKYLPLNEVLENSDIITVHVPLTKDGDYPTFQLINDDFIKNMKDKSILINSSRGKVMSEKSIFNYKDKFLALIFDVWEKEPEIDENFLNITDIATQHIAGYSYDGKVCGTMMIYKACCEFFNMIDQWDVDISDNSLIIDLKNSKNLIYDALTKAYPILKDNNNLKKIVNYPKVNQPKYFDELRKTYPIRREFKNYSLIVEKKENEKEIEILKNLGFKIK